MEYIARWNERIFSYCQQVEQQMKEKEAKAEKKWQLTALIDSMKDIISRMEQGDVWEPFDINTPEAITYQFTYPNGKNGDIDMYIANRYGQVEQVDAVQYSVSLPTAHKEQILLLEYIYAHSPHNDIPRNELDQFLCDYNLGHRLRQYCDTYLTLKEGYSSSETEAEKMRRLNNEKIRSKAMEVTNDYMQAIRCERNKVYAEIVERGLASAQWVSEQKAYLIVKNLYPDTIFQYHAEWLGDQSLDIYIPSRKIGIEYQGKQHFERVDFFGGDEGLRQTLIRDESKRKKCIDSGITLIEWRYDAPLTEEYIKDKISEAGHQN